MIIRRIKDLLGTEREVHGDGFVSRRLLLAKDGMGFSVSETIVTANKEHVLWYKQHLEAVFCIEGEGEIENIATGDSFEITPGTLYALNQHDRHRVKTRTQLRLFCVFNPPLTGDETHDADGSYELR